MIIKEIYFDNDTGKLTLLTSDNNHFLCNLYGNPVIKFYPNITGIANGKQRKEFPQATIETPKPRIRSAYLPTTKKFECYSKYPRPLVAPLTNLPQNDVKAETKQTLINTLKEHFTNKTGNDIFSMKANEMKYLSYLHRPLSSNNRNEKTDINKIIKLIDDTIQSWKSKSEIETIKVRQSPMYKALTKFKRFLILTQNEEKFNKGRRLNEPDKEIKALYGSINRVINRKGLSSAKPKEVYKRRLTDLFHPIKIKINKREEQDISFISNSDNNDDYKKIKNEKDIKCYKELNINTECHTTKEDQMYFRRRTSLPKFKTEGDLFRKNTELLNRVNPMNALNEEKRAAFDYNQLKKRKERTILGLIAQGVQYNHKVNIKKKNLNII